MAGSERKRAVSRSQDFGSGRIAHRQLHRYDNVRRGSQRGRKLAGPWLLRKTGMQQEWAHMVEFGLRGAQPDLPARLDDRAFDRDEATTGKHVAGCFILPALRFR